MTRRRTQPRSRSAPAAATETEPVGGRPPVVPTLDEVRQVRAGGHVLRDGRWVPERA